MAQAEDDKVISPFIRREMIQRGAIDRGLPDRSLSRYPGGAAATPGANDDLSDLEKYQEQMMRAMRRQSDFQSLHNVPYTTAAQLILPASQRTYLFIQNVAAASILYIGIGIEPASGRGVYLAAVNGWYEPFQVPQNDIWIVGNGAGNCNILYAND